MFELAPNLRILRAVFGLNALEKTVILISFFSAIDTAH